MVKKEGKSLVHPPLLQTFRIVLREGWGGGRRGGRCEIHGLGRGFGGGGICPGSLSAARFAEKKSVMGKEMGKGSATHTMIGTYLQGGP